MYTCHGPGFPPSSPPAHLYLWWMAREVSLVAWDSQWKVSPDLPGKSRSCRLCRCTAPCSCPCRRQLRKRRGSWRSRIRRHRWLKLDSFDRETRHRAWRHWTCMRSLLGPLPGTTQSCLRHGHARSSGAVKSRRRTRMGTPTTIV